MYEMMEAVYDTYKDVENTSLLKFPINTTNTIKDFNIDDHAICCYSIGNYVIVGYNVNKLVVRNIEKGYLVCISPRFLKVVEDKTELFKAIYGKK